ncbi:MFS transporter [Pelagibacterium luteolum]|uniref:MFS transporter, FSR family, fosmidomycin resistance protein n=1 Tax=Pelagibacterium luteolum TaxID=440168 RepID=A0A1G7WAZ6_9HYPH|nr:MFS transporter [Pelagibacterium luteolum]SDG69132.1 MFS transporter, FSR family, fosmidomycin resistance protein [Pelagibacterium luteolum]
MTTTATAAPAPAKPATSFWVLFAISFSHLLNDLMQSLLPAVYPLLRDLYALDFTQIGLITLVNQMTASLLQPVVGLYTDKYPKPYSLPIAMCSTLAGLMVLSSASSFPMLLLAAALIGVGSSIFHPESSRVARMASGGRLGFAQSLFQVGGNIGTAFGPLLAAFIIIPRGQGSVAWFALVAITAILVLSAVSTWYAGQNRMARPQPVQRRNPAITRNRLIGAFAVIAVLVMSKNVYMASMTSFYAFFLIENFGLDASTAQLYLFVFLGAAAAGTFIGGPVGDKVGRKVVIWVSILGPLPFTLALPYVGLEASIVLTALIGFILASAFSAILVYAQELLPGRVGMIAGLMFGFAFGMGALGAAVLGIVADLTSIIFVFQLCSFLPLAGLLTALLPNTGD